ncbi:hypothetical protein WJX84_001959 [Apatococcus fuscideae]|uniref:Uncharacterized protein n=1 Tax=Apatococcus fuscideae TaxID=2026836 RepID=A0AAW1TCS2_9CHLO
MRLVSSWGSLNSPTRRSWPEPHGARGPKARWTPLLGSWTALRHHAQQLMEGAERPPGHEELLLQIPRKGDAKVSKEYEDWGTEFPVTAGSVGCGDGRSLGMEPSENMEVVPTCCLVVLRAIKRAALAAEPFQDI